MALPDKLKTLRQNKRWTQKELAEKINTDKYNISRYECGLTTPSLDMIIKLANIFQTSIDYLVFEDDKDGIIKDPTLRRYFEKIENMKDDDKEAIKKVVEAMIYKTESID